MEKHCVKTLHTLQFDTLVEFRMRNNPLRWSSGSFKTQSAK